MKTDHAPQPDDAPVCSTDWLVTDELEPSTGGALAPLYEAAARGELALPRCERCSEPLELEQDVCDRCQCNSAVWSVLEPRGHVHAVTTVHRGEPGLIREDAPPYQVADIELTSGHRLIMTTARPTARPLRVGDAARIGFRRVGKTAVPALETRPDDGAPQPEPGHESEA